MEPTFATYLTTALRQIKRLEHKNLAVIQDELGYALGRDSGGSVIEFWRKGHLPASLHDLEQLCRQLQHRAKLDASWMLEFLRTGKHPYPEQFCEQLFSGQRPIRMRPALRAPTGDFTGREAEIARICALLEQPNPQTSIIAIRGMGGAGKTELAYRIAHEVREHWNTGQLLVPLYGTSAQPLSPEQALQRCLALLGSDVAASLDLELLTARYASALVDQRLLLIADDALDAQQIQHLIPPPGSVLLITTRRRFTLPGMHTLDLDMLDPPAANRLVLRICPQIGEHAARLSQRCGFLPLALRISASELASDDTQTPASYLARLDDERSRLQRLRTSDGTNLDVAASLNLSLNALNPACRTGLLELSVITGSFDSSLAEAILAAPPAAASTMLSQLRRHSLLQFDPASARYSLHDLVRSLARSQLADEGPIWLRYGTECLRVVRAASSAYRQGDAAIPSALDAFDQILPHLLAVWSWLLPQPAQPQRDTLVLELARATIFLGDLRFNSRQQRIPQLRHALAAAQRLHDEQGQYICAINLGRAHFQLHEFVPALDYFTLGLHQTRALNQRRAEANALDNLAQIHIELTRFELARQQLEQAVAITRDINDRFGEAASLNNLGVICLRQGRLEEAEQYLHQALIAIREVGYQRGEAWALSYLGLIQTNRSAFAAASSTFEQGLAIARILGDAAVETRLLAYRGWLALRQLDLEVAHELLEAAHSLAEAQDEWSDQHWITGKLGILWFVWGDQQRGLDLYAQRLHAAPIQHDWGVAEDSRILGRLLLEAGSSAGAAIYQRWIEYQHVAQHVDMQRDHEPFNQLKRRPAPATTCATIAST